MDATDFVGAFGRLTRAFQSAKISPVHLSILSEVAKRPASVPLLASALSMTTGAAAKAVDALVRRGLLRKEGPSVAPTEKGAEVWAAVAQAIGGAASIATAISGFITSLSGVVEKWSDHALPPRRKKRRRP